MQGRCVASSCTTATPTCSTRAPKLKDLSGLRNLQTAYGDVSIVDNASITDLSGLDSLQAIDTLFLGRNASLTSVEGNAFTSVEHYLGIFDNPALTSLAGLEGLSSVGTDVSIRDNPQLVDISALGNLTNIGGNLRIQDNDQLPACAAVSLRDAIGIANIDGTYPTNCDCAGAWEATGCP